jgi:hypothetical protein
LKFRLSPDFVIDSEQKPWNTEGLRVCIFGGAGSGKSWTAALLAEQFLSQGGSVVIFQPRAEYHTLRQKFDVVVVGGPYAKDMDFIPSSPSAYAKAVSEDGLSLVFYTTDVESEEKLVDFASRFMHYLLKYQEVNRRPVMLILEESQDYIPKSPSGHAAPSWVYMRMTKAFKDGFLQGRKLNVVMVAVSPRPQEVNFTARQLCVASTAKVYTDLGTFSLGRLARRENVPSVLSYGGSLRCVQPFLISKRKPEPNEVVRVTTESGLKLKLSKDHPIYTQRGWVRAEELTEQDYVACLHLRERRGEVCRKIKGVVVVGRKNLKKASYRRFLKKIGLFPLTYSDPRMFFNARLLGNLFGDGCLLSNGESIVFTGHKEELDAIEHDLIENGYPGRIERGQRHMDSEIRGRRVKGVTRWLRINCAPLHCLMRVLGAPVGSKTEQNFHAPQWLMEAPLPIKQEFVAAFCGSELKGLFLEPQHIGNFQALELSQNKVEGVECDFLSDIQNMLAEAGSLPN